MSPRVLLVTALALPLLAACHKASIASYRIPKEKDPEMPMAAGGGGASGAAQAPAGGGMAGTPVQTAGGPGLTWSAPSDWKPKPGSAMRKGSFSVPGEGGAEGDLSITAFPGDVGGELANVNRWRGQVQQPPITEADLPKEVAHAQHNGLTFGIVDVAGAGQNPQRILGAFVPYEGATWFIKLAGPDALIAKAKPAFMDFLATVKPSADSGDTPSASGATAASAPPAQPSGGAGMANTAVPTAEGSDLTWSAPSDWQQKPGSAMRKGSYTVGGDGDLSITAFPGDVGGELANVNRWRGQVQLPPISEAELADQVTRADYNGLHFGIVDVTGKGANAPRILGAFVPYGGATWFIKLAGPNATVGKAKPGFLAFLQTVKPAAPTAQ